MRHTIAIAAAVLVALASSPVAAAPLGGAPALGAEPPTGAAGVWLAGDLHIHTTYSHDSYGGPDDDNTGPDEAYTLGNTVEEQFRVAASRGLDFLAITDHNDVRSQADPGWATHGLLAVPGYENSMSGHAQMLGATRLYPDASPSTDPDAVAAEADALRADGGVFQINHPSEGATDPDHLDWSLGYAVVPDTVEVWNISRLWQPPAPSASSNDDAVRFWEGWLDRGYRVGATGGSDNHYKATLGAQGPGQPTTWVLATEPTVDAVLEGLRAGRTTISHQPPTLGGPRLFLEGDGDGDGAFEAVVGDEVRPGSDLRVRVDGAPGSLLHVVTTGGRIVEEVPVTATSFEHRFTLAAEESWVRAELVEPDAAEERATACDGAFGEQTTYCRNDLAVLAMTSALYLATPDADVSDAFVRVTDDQVVVGNGRIERTYTREPYGTASIVDRRTGLATGPTTDLRLELAGGDVLTGADLHVTDVRPRRLADGSMRVDLVLEPSAGPVGEIVRTVTVHPDAAAVRTTTRVALPVTVTGYTIDEVAIPGAAPTIHHFNAGYDWRGSDTPDWEPTLAPFGGAHTGDHRESTTAGPGEALEGRGQWLSLVDGGGARALLVTERVNYDSTRAAFDGTTGRAFVDLAHDVAYLGPFEADIHVANPAPVPVRARVASPADPLLLEPVTTGLGVDADDEPWQFHLALERRAPDWDRVVTFNSNGVDSNRISTGAKDDMDLAEVQRQAAVARRLGIETFILDDGWQARSGDWCPDSPECPEPRDTWGPRFPDATFEAVRAEIAPMELGLWMSPMHFHPTSNAYRDNPEWACSPVGDALAVYNTVEPESSSNEAGLGTWNPLATSEDGLLIDHVERAIRRAVEVYGARYFKFDFLVWLDCADVAPADAYDYREAFVAMVDRVQAAHPDVTIQIDETNDYRLFPFESVSRGPTWYANGNPSVDEALHNLWSLAPYVPGYALGQSAMGDLGDLPTGTVMAAALGSHVTFFDDLTQLTDQQVTDVASWLDVYRRHRDRFATFTYPLLDDPVGGTSWTALQPWDADEQRGALLVFRQRADDDTVSVPLRGVRGDGSYRITDAVTGEVVGTFPAAALRSGVPVTLGVDEAAVWLVDPVREIATTLTYVGDAVVRGRHLRLAARLVDADGAPLVGETVTFALDGRAHGALTDQDGVAETVVTAPTGVSWDVTARFDGSGVYLPSSVTATVRRGAIP